MLTEPWTTLTLLLTAGRRRRCRCARDRTGRSARAARRGRPR